MANDTDFEMDEMREIIDDFLIEADELIDSLDSNLVKLETAPEDLDLLNEIFRAAHTIKGTSSFLGLEQVTSLTHKMEDILNKLRKSEMAVTPNIMDLMLEAIDILKVLLNNVKEGNLEEVDIGDIIPRLIAIQTSQDSDSTSQAAASASDSPASQSQSGEKPSAVKSAGDMKVVDQTIRVDVERLDTLMNLVGELVLSRNGLIQTINQANLEKDVTVVQEQLNRVSASVNSITTELQMAVMNMRMQPIGKVFSKFPRQVRDLAREAKKEIELQISGEETELDKSVIEEIGDPLVHLIRNSCDHGIESPEDRVTKGKPSKGVVKLSASQEGSNIIIRIEDDGKGLDVEAIKQKAVERGLATETEVRKMPDREIFHFIFEAGFSTAKVVSDVSGRGVGMDVVRTNIEKLSGLIELDSTRGVGAVTTIKLPLTLAIMQGLLVESDDEVFILPLLSVYETVKTDNANIYYVNQRPVLRLRDDIIPIMNLGEVLRKSNSGFIMTEKPYIIIIGLADRKLGIIIDRFIGQEEIVIKSLGTYLGTTEGIAGATILGDGRIRLIIDLLGLFNIARKLN